MYQRKPYPPRIIYVDSSQQLVEFTPDPLEFDQERAKEYFSENWFLKQCGRNQDIDQLTADPLTFLDFILESVVQYGSTQINKYRDDWFSHHGTVLDSAVRKLFEALPNDDQLWLISPNLFHNNYINIFTKDTSEIVVPSRLYVFTEDTGNVDIRHFYIRNVDRSSPAECILNTIRSRSKDHMLHPLLIMKQTKQEILVKKCRVMSLTDTDQDSSREENVAILKLILKGLNFSRNATYVQIMWSYLSSTAFNHIARQLTGCTKLVELDLHGSKSIQPTMGAALATMKSLKVLNLSNCPMETETVESITDGLSNCLTLENLCLEHTCLTGCLGRFLGDSAHPGFPVLEELNLSHTQIEREDMESICTAAFHGKLQKLKSLSLSNNILTFGFEGPPELCMYIAFPQLEDLDLHSLQLDQDDMEAITKAAYSGHFPQLQTLNLSSNILSNGFRCRNRDNDQLGFPSLQKLNMSKTKIIGSDLKGISSAVEPGTLETLDLSHNILMYALDGLLQYNNTFACPRRLNLRNTKLSSVDIQVIFRMNTEGLGSLDLSENPLRGDLAELLEDHPGFPSLISLHLSDTKLNREDTDSLCDAIFNGKMPRLGSLDTGDSSFSGDNMVTLTKSGRLPGLRFLQISFLDECLNEAELEAFMRECGKEGMGLTLSIDRIYHDFAYSMNRDPHVHLSFFIR